ncbi:cytochrome b-c1 complex subunit 8-like [Tubulanus polymorphus]|uniref:cytochrome b-c1 complex subunit 8-like n=1 Tax=Tubulanus polymorphus TaxID=672921 RepID=UPI003DA5D6F9
MGRTFGNLGIKVYGIVQYSLSPFEQRAFAGILKNGIPNTFRRVKGQIFRFMPPLVVAYLVYDWGTKENARFSRKDPAEFANDS